MCSWRRAATHDDEIQSLYEEMEQQIKDEKDRLLLQVPVYEKLTLPPIPLPLCLVCF